MENKTSEARPLSYGTVTEMNRSPRREGNPSQRPFIFITDDGSGTEKLYDILRRCAEIGVGGIIPLPMEHKDDDGISSADELLRFRKFYERLLPECVRLGLRVALSMTKCVESAVIQAEEDRWEYGIRARRLERKIHYCSSDEHVSISLTESPRMSLVAYNEDRDEVVDLREKVRGLTLEWDVPRGNWQIVEYVCVPDTEKNRPDILSKEASGEYFEAAYGLFGDLVEKYLGTTVTHLYIRDLAFDSRNRHDWTEKFNEVFRERYGFDPAAAYPYLFTSSGNNADHYKALLFDCRARMLRDGFLLAAEEFADRNGLELFVSIAEPKLSQCSFVTGDALLDNTVSPCAVFDRSYLYGINSVKLAAGAAFGRAIRDIYAELYRGYPKLEPEIMLRDAEHAFARGANLPAIHVPPHSADNAEDEKKFLKLFKYVSNVRGYLSRGRQVCDIAVIYPIYSLHSAVNLYDAKVKGFEYPDTPCNADYMSLINSICLYSGHDATLLHPDVIVRSARGEKSMLRLEGMSDEGGFRVVVLPSRKFATVGCMRVLKEYFDAGGRIIATGQLPSRAFEFDPADPEKYDREVRDIVDHIFGVAADNPQIMREYCHNTGENGGSAYFLSFAITAADGTDMVNSRTIDDALESLDTCYDVYAPDMPRFESTGALNNPFNEFKRLGLQRHLPGGGMFSHIHKRHGSRDIYFFSNTTDHPASTPIFLRGAHDPVCIDPMEETEWTPECSFVLVEGTVYTRLEISLGRNGSVIIVSEDAERREAELDVSTLEDRTLEARHKNYRKGFQPCR